jgi:hypothetical protein
MELSQLNGRRIALLLCTTGRFQVFTGTGRFACDVSIGDALRIELDDADNEEGNPAFVIRSDQWSGSVAPDTEHGCDYRIDLCPRR